MRELFWAVAQHIFTQIESREYWTAINSPDVIGKIDAAAVTAAYGQKEVIRKENGVAIIDINGMMMRNPDIFDVLFYGATDTAKIEEAVKSAASDGNIEQIILMINSPGGAVSGTPELGRAVAAAQAVKPVTAYCSDMCASAAYWVAAQAGKIYANETAVVGSIGVRMLLHDYSGMYEAAGIKAIPIDTGKFKSAGTPGTEVTADQVEMFQTIVNEHFTRFADAVKTGRGMSDKKFEAVKDAQILSAASAKEAGLIDGVATVEDVVSSIFKKKAKGRSTASGRARLALYEV